MVAGRSNLFSGVKHMLSSGADMTKRKGSCVMHLKRTCSITKRPSCVITGLSCRPFSLLRGGKSSCHAQTHEDFNMLIEFLEYIDVARPHGGIIEQVLGMTAKIKPQHFQPTWYCQELPTSWLSFLLSELQRKGYSTKVMKFDNAIWHDVKRVRFTS